MFDDHRIANPEAVRPREPDDPRADGDEFVDDGDRRPSIGAAPRPAPRP